MSNRLARETSPYLLQHAENPVHWWPWCEQAIATAREQQKPIFLSVGYSACHWCHVMEHESFEDQTTADYLNEHFVSIKVDREERPDIDQIYMQAVQLMTQQGGWPLSVFLTPQLEPFYGGTYWPPEPQFQRPSFIQVLQAIQDAWQNRREAAIEQGGVLTGHLRKLGGDQKPGAGEAELSASLGDLVLSRLKRIYDKQWGGFGSAPKFPHPMDIQLLIRHAVTRDKSQLMEIACHTLDKMAAGGIYDHLGGGFARYSVDARWLVPHFEKMLYDNALLAEAYLDAHLATGRDSYRQVVQETLEYVLRDLTDQQGGFHSSEDADSEGEEGKFYVWRPQELRDVLGEQAAERFAAIYDVQPGGNFEGKSILHLPQTYEQSARLHDWDLPQLRAEMAESRRKLLAARSLRVRPGKDDKILANWNSLMINALARAGAALDEPRYVEAAERAASFIQREMFQDGRLRHSWRCGRAAPIAFLDDYAGMIQAPTSLYEATWNEAWIDWAGQLTDTVLQHFHDPQHGGFYFTADDHETLISRNKDLHDSSLPSGNALAATGLLRLGKLCGRQDWLAAAEATLAMAAPQMEKSPMTGQLFIALDWLLGPTSEVVVVGGQDGQQDQQVTRLLRGTYAPRRVLAGRVAATGPSSPLLAPLFAGKQAGDDPAPRIYVCRDHACQEPVIGIGGARQLLQAASQKS